jgi:DNA-binding beta-propeller fold protein YncE
VVYVAERRQHKIIAFDEATRKVRFYGDAVGARLGLIIGIAVDDQGVVYAVDQRARRVFAYNEDGSLARVYGQHDEFKRPTGVAVDRARGRLYVADVGYQAVVVLELGTGRRLAAWGKAGTGKLEFAFPGLLALDRDGNLLVADQLNFRIQVLSPEGAFVRAIGGPGDRPGSFFRLKGVAVDSENHYYAVDEAFANLQVFRSDGQILLFLGQGGPRPGEFSMPVGVCVSSDDVVWVAESTGSRIQGIRYLRNAHIPSRAPQSQPATAPAGAARGAP